MKKLIVQSNYFLWKDFFKDIPQCDSLSQKLLETFFWKVMNFPIRKVNPKQSKEKSSIFLISREVALALDQVIIYCRYYWIVLQ